MCKGKLNSNKHINNVPSQVSGLSGQGLLTDQGVPLYLSYLVNHNSIMTLLPSTCYEMRVINTNQVSCPWCVTKLAITTNRIPVYLPVAVGQIEILVMAVAVSVAVSVSISVSVGVTGVERGGAARAGRQHQLLPRVSVQVRRRDADRTAEPRARAAGR